MEVPEPHSRLGQLAGCRSIFNPSYIICGVFGLYTHFPLHILLPHPVAARQDHVAGAVTPLLDAHQVAQVLERDCPPQCQHRSRAVAYTDVERRLYFQSLLYNMRGFCLLHTLSSTHTFTPFCRARQDHVAGAVR